MALVAAILRDPRISMTEWMACIDQNDVLARRPPRQIINPFKKTTETFEESPAAVQILCDGVAVGAIDPGPEFAGDGELQVWAADGKHAVVRQMAMTVAFSLRATLEWFGDEE